MLTASLGFSVNKHGPTSLAQQLPKLRHLATRIRADRLPSAKYGSERGGRTGRAKGRTLGYTGADGLANVLATGVG